MADMEGIEAIKARANAAYARGQHLAAIELYTAAAEASEREGRPGLLHLLYSNRCGPRPPLSPVQDHPTAIPHSALP